MQPRALDLTYNPFEDDDDEQTPHNRQYFGSAFLSNAQSPTLRRRLSLGASESPSAAIRKRHSRSRSEFSIDIPDSEIVGHPLRSAALKSAAFQDFEITRPNLSRLVQNSSSMTRSVSHDSGFSVETCSPQDGEMDVIVHTITSKDSLAGVSLKYGISLAELRRANQLWTNDTIHLRKYLYIPISRAKRAHEYLAEMQSSQPIVSTRDDRIDTERIRSSSAYPSPLSSVPSPGIPSPAGSTSDPTAPSFRRIPASQLSFFPPSANPGRSRTPSRNPSPTSSEFPSQRAPPIKPNNPTNRVGPSPAHSLTSLLTALPIAASTRDEIVSRLSFDSVSSSYSDVPRSRTGSDDDPGHEMKDVHLHRRDEDDLDSPSAKTPRLAFPNEIVTSYLKTKNKSSPHQMPYGRSLSSTSPPSSYIPQQSYNPYVRTQQLEPSPVMQLPLRDMLKSDDPKPSQNFAKKSPYRSASAEPRNRSAKKSQGSTTNPDSGIELEFT